MQTKIGFNFLLKYKQEILKNLQATDSLSPPPPSPLPKEKMVKKDSSSWIPVTCYGQFALPVLTCAARESV